MKIKHQELEIPKEDPFKHCKLNRSQFAEALTSVVQTYSDGFVLSVNNPWGTGKTTFIKMWQARLEANNFSTLYFNAWENDFDSNPLVAILSELGTLTKKDEDKAFRSLIKKAAVISNKVLPALVKAIASKYLDSEVLADVLGNATEGATEILKDEIDEYAKKKKGLVDFRLELQKFIAEKVQNKPLVLFIDELDRCRPNYAVEVLEQIKHFFSVPGIVFVLSIDKVQLGNAIKGVYGSELMDSNEYLRRFIDLEFSLPQPNKNEFNQYLFEYFGFGKYFFAEKRKLYHQIKDDGDSFIRFANIFFAQTEMTLRQQEKIFALARVVLNTFAINNYMFPTLFLMLIYLKEFFPALYNMLYSRKVSPQEMLDKLSEVLPKKLHENEYRIFLYTEVLLTKLYNNYYSEIIYTSKLTDRDDEGNTTLLIQSNIDKSKNSADFLNMLQSVNRGDGADVKLSHLLNKINLMDNFKDQ